jgi:molybdate transport system ATP-binding protein
MTGTFDIALQFSHGSFGLDVDLALPSDGISVIFGPSGCGKTSLLRCVAGLESSARGVVQFGEQTWLDSRAGKFVPVAQRQLGFVFQDGALFPHLNVEKNLQYALSRVSKQDQRFSHDGIVELLDLSSLCAQEIHELSGGERQRVALGRALLSSPRLLLLDEPLASLDRLRRREILPYFERLADELALPMLYVTHDLDEAARLGDHLVVMENGKAPVCGPLMEVLASSMGNLLQGHERRTIVPAMVKRLHTADNLLELDFPGGALWTPASVPAQEGLVRLSVQARDVSITLKKPQDSSILNILPGVVGNVTEEGPGRNLVQVAVGETTILAQITGRSCRSLELKPGKAVFVQIKSVALL